MNAAHFTETRRPAWERVEALIKKAGGRPAKLDQAELHELTRLYPAVAVDVARARLIGADRTTQDRINRLAVAAHGLLYRPPRPRKAVLVRFFRHDYPVLVRRCGGPIGLAAALLLAAALSAYAAVRTKPELAYLLLPQGLEVRDIRTVTVEDISERFRRTPQSIMASFITTNNITVALSAFALGITAGVGTAYVLLTNGVMLGVFFAHFTNHGLAGPCWSFLAPHGLLEISAIVIAGGAGLRLGWSLAVPGSRTRRLALREGAKEAVLLVLGTVPFFMVAGAIESFITPSYLGGAPKVLVGVLAAGAAWTYLLGAGRPSGPAKEPETAG